MATQAPAAWYNLTFTGGSSIASGVIDVSGNTAISGVIDVSTGPATGLWTLVPGTGSDGSFYWDNQVFPNSNPYLDSAGLLFSGPSPSSQYELNLWGNGPSTLYSFWGNIGGNWNPEDTGTVTLTAIPEASTTVASALMLLPLGVSAVRIMRKSRMA